MTGRLADEKEARVAALLQVAGEPPPAERGGIVLAVEVEGRSDPRRREVAYEELAPHRTA